MKSLAVSVGIVALAFGLVAASVFGLGDDRTLVSPPEAVAQEFVRALAQNRRGPARALLSRRMEREVSIDSVGRMAASLRSQIGRLEDVEAVAGSERRDLVVVHLHVEGERDTTDLSVPMVREYGAWSVHGVGDIRGRRTGAPANRNSSR